MRFRNRTKIFAAVILLIFFAACSPTPARTVTAPTAIVMATAVQLNTAPAVQNNKTDAPAQLATVTPPLPPAQSVAPTDASAQSVAPTDAPAPTQNTSSQSAATAPVPTLSSQLSPSVTPLPQLPTRPPTPAPAQSATPAPPQVSREALAGKILFKSTRNGGKYPNNFKWFVMNADGSQVEQVEAARAKELYLSLKGQEGYSPDRSMLVLGERTCAANAHCDLYVGAPEVIMNRSQGQWTPTGQRWYRADNPVWSPLGDWIAFVWNRDNDRTKNIFKGDPYKLNQDFKRLTDFGGHRDTKDPTFSPDATMLAFATQDGPYWQIWALNATADNPNDAAARNLSNSGADDWEPLWIK